jgi:hypothetical protein
MLSFLNARGADLSMKTKRAAGRWRILALLICVAAGAWALDLAVLAIWPRVWISGIGRMAPAIEYGDLVRENRWALRGRDPVPGEVLAWVVPGVPNAWPARVASALRQPVMAGRVIAVPGDAVATQGIELVINGKTLPQEKMAPGPDAAKAASPRFLQRIGQREVVTTYVPPLVPPKPCLSEQPQVLSSDQFLLATDERPVARLYCLIVPRAYIVGLIDRVRRTGTAP